MKYATIKMLKDRNAYDYQIELFNQIFGNKAAITKANIIKAVKAGLSVQTFFNWYPELSIDDPGERNTVIPEAGDTVLIRKNLWLGPYGYNSIVEDMLEFAGKKAIVTDVYPNSTEFYIEGSEYGWTPEMLDPKKPIIIKGSNNA